MKLYLSKTHSDVDGSMANEGKLAIIYSNKEDIRNLTEFFNKVNTYLEDNEYCHMQFRDYFENWSEENHIDIEINVDER